MCKLCALITHVHGNKQQKLLKFKKIQSLQREEIEKGYGNMVDRYTFHPNLALIC